MTHEERHKLIDELIQRDLANKAYLVSVLYVGFDGYANMSEENLLALKDGKWVNLNDPA